MSAPILKHFFTKVVAQTGSNATGTVIFLHGSGDTGIGVHDWVCSVLGREFSFPHLRVLFPTAPPRPYSPMMGQLSTVWHDRSHIMPGAPDDSSVDNMMMELSALIQHETDSGIPLNRIMFGGFSMGGGMALQLVYRQARAVAGVFALSSFLGTNSKVYKSLTSMPQPVPPLFQCHGERDKLVLHQWGKDTNDKLAALGVATQFHSVPNMYHEMDKATLEKLVDWINERVPPYPSQSSL